MVQFAPFQKAWPQGLSLASETDSIPPNSDFTYLLDPETHRRTPWPFLADCMTPSEIWRIYNNIVLLLKDIWTDYGYEEKEKVLAQHLYWQWGF